MTSVGTNYFLPPMLINLPVFLVLKLGVPPFLHLFKPKTLGVILLPGSLFPTPVVECGFEYYAIVLDLYVILAKSIITEH